MEDSDQINAVQGIVTNQSRDVALNLLSNQRRYKDAVALCALNKSVQAVCQTPAGKKIMKTIEAEDCLEVMINSWTSVHRHLMLLFYIHEGVMIPLDNQGGWKRVEDIRRIPDEDLRILKAVTLSKKPVNEKNWAKTVIKVIRKWPFYLRLNLSLIMPTDDLYEHSSFDNALANHLFRRTPVSRVAAAELVQLLEINLYNVDNVAKYNQASMYILLNYERWMSFFQRTMSESVSLFSEIKLLQ